MMVARLLIGLGTIAVISFVIYGVIELLPGDIAREVLKSQATDESVRAFNERLGLDRPFLERYFEWLGNALHGDLGRSLISDVPVSELLAQRVKNSAFLAVLAAVLAVPLALLLGILSATFRNSVFDRATGITTLACVSLPEFALGYLMILFLAVKTGLFPSLSVIDPGAPLLERIWQTVLPALTLTLIVQAHMSRMTRSSLVALFQRPYIEMAELKGLRRRKVVWRHALPNAMGPIAVVITLNMAYLLTGIVVIEAVFAYPGLGQLMVDAVARRDIPLVQAASLIFATFYVSLNTLADVIGIVTNPRLLYARK
ncbi:MAG: ABC transporter permease [Rhodobacteraceae bacterium]|nr:ABC transporter permease [Paracoccaceae bacterium]